MCPLDYEICKMSVHRDNGLREICQISWHGIQQNLGQFRIACEGYGSKKSRNSVAAEVRVGGIPCRRNSVNNRNGDSPSGCRMYVFEPQEFFNSPLCPIVPCTCSISPYFYFLWRNFKNRSVAMEDQKILWYIMQINITIIINIVNESWIYTRMIIIYS